MTRQIIRDDTILGGRWHLEGTTIPVAQIRQDFLSLGMQSFGETYAFLNLTETELQRINSFPFEPVRETHLDTEYATITIACECGEDTLVGMRGAIGSAKCICGRNWEVVHFAQATLLFRDGETHAD